MIHAEVRDAQLARGESHAAEQDATRVVERAATRVVEQDAIPESNALQFEEPAPGATRAGVKALVATASGPPVPDETRHEVR